VRFAYSEARVCLRAARGAIEGMGDSARALDWLLRAYAWRDHGRKMRVRRDACAAHLAGRQTREQELAWMAYVDLLARFF